MSFYKQIDIQIQLLNKIKHSSDFHSQVELAVKIISQALSKGLPLLICGNGGSASDALHISGELVGRFLKDRAALNVLCLNTNISVLTAWSNDHDFASVFARQVKAHGRPGGLCWGISTSGNSENIFQALQQAKKLNMKTIALTGKGGGRLTEIADVLIAVPSRCTPRVQELHLPVYHYICEQVEARLAAIDLMNG